MTVSHYPGNLRVGVMHLPIDRVQDPGPQAVAPKQLLLVLLNGHQRFRMDDREFVLSTAGGAPQALLLRVEQPATLEFYENRGEPLSKIAVATDPDWLSLAQPGNPATRAGVFSGHLASHQWRPPAQMIALATELIATARHRHGAPAPHAVRLFRMSRGIDLLNAALACLDPTDNGAAPPDLPPVLPADMSDNHPKVAQLRRYVADHLSDPGLSPEQLARACGIGLRSLQRLCRDTLQCSPGDLIRHQRFEAAYAALRSGAANVSQAAFMTGYTSSANFSTAFKREYGIAPKYLRHPAADSGR